MMGVAILYLVIGLFLTGFVSEWFSIKEPMVSTCVTLFWPCVMFGILAGELAFLGRTAYKKWAEGKEKESEEK